MLAAGAAVAPAARAAEAMLQLQIPPQPRKAALLALARQSGLSIGFPASLQCPGRGAAVGLMTASEALERILKGSGCRAVRLDARTVAIETEPRPMRPPAASPRPPLSPQPPAPAAELAELVVTATKREESLRDAPYAITALTGEELQREGVVGTGGLPAVAAGVTVTNLGPGRDKVILRGLSDSPLTGHTQSTVGIYLDELRLTYNAPDPDLKWVDVARVEVLRGPQGSLYGSGSIGGVLHVVTAAPDPQARAGRITAYGEATRDAAASYGLDGMFNQPIADGRGAVRLVGWSEVVGGYVDNRGTGVRDADRTRRSGFRASALWEARPDLSLTASLIHQSINSADTHYAEPSVGNFARATPHPEPHDNDLLAADLTLRWTPSWGEVTLSSGALEHDVASRYDASLAPAELAPSGEAPAIYDDDNDIKGLVNEARIASRGPGRWQWLVGAFAAFGQQDLSGAMIGTRGGTGYAETRRDRLLETAVFGETSYALSRRLTVTLGGRLFSSSVRTRSHVSQSGGQRSFDGKTSDSGFAPKLVAAYSASSELSLYVQAAEGYRSGGFNTSGPLSAAFGSGAGAAQPRRRYIGDELWSYEAGLRWRPSPAWRLRAALFHANWRDIQADLLLPSGLPFTGNIGDGRSSGAEVEAAYASGPWTLTANLTAQEPELNRPDPTFARRGDASLPGVPKLAYGLGASWRRPLPGARVLEASARFAYVGRSHLTLDAQTAPTMGGYGELRLALALQSHDLRLELYGENLADSRDDTFAYGNPFSLRRIPQTTPQRPRTLGFSLSRSF